MSITRTLFAQDWYLEATAPGAWTRLTSGDPGNGAELVITERGSILGRSVFGHAPLSYRLGPMYDLPSDLSAPRRLSREHELCADLIEQIPRHASFLLNFDWRTTNALPFYWRGYDLGLLYTYVIDDVVDHDRVWDGLTSSCRRAIRKAEDIVEVRNGTAAELYELHAETMTAQGRTIGYDEAFLDRLVTSASAHDAGEVLIAADADGRSHAGVMIVWGSDCAYYLVGGTAHDLRQSGAMSMAMWEGIKRASKRVPTFDFEGSMSPGVERFLRTFGARQAPYIQVRHDDGLGAATRMVQQARRTSVGGLRRAWKRL